jgi:large subunit ribosomal protein L17
MRTNLAKAVRRGLIREVLIRGKIETTLTYAKSVQGEIDRVINLLKKKSVNSRRQIVKMLGQDLETSRDFSDRVSGYTKITRLGKRFSDAVEMVILELIEKTAEPVKIEPVVEEKPKVVKKTKKTNVKSN